MSTEPEKAAPAAAPAPAADGKAKAAPAAAKPAADGEKALSGAALKQKKKEEKAAKRAQAKMTQGGPTGPPAADAKGGKPAQNKNNFQPGAHQGHVRSGSRSTLPVPQIKDTKPKVPECFSHLSMAKRISITHANKDVNPIILLLGQQMSKFAIRDSITRLETTLLAFKKLIEAYTTPHGTTLSRHFVTHVLNPQIEYLTACRPICFSMGNAIRWLKLQISKIDIDLPDAAAKQILCQAIDSFVHERVTLADYVIVSTAAQMVSDGDVVVSYAHHHLVERVLLQAKKDGKDFKVILIDDPFERVGLEHAKRLSAAGISVAYTADLGALRTNLQQATSVFVAAEAMFSNGAMYARAGTCDIATTARDLGLRVVALCETINFTERVSIDSLTYNEIDPDRNTDEAFRLLFDTTTDKFISVVVTELGNSSPKSVPAILKKLEEL
ncbi:Putative Translation initiation factor eIF-2B subunit delta [[Torrubiella] hemipterigena]|uniref:Translation initiation factor eIF2B subunit delta n=1 Tax=[Torrubiella] hemipterigena TaxID=1531966 RepID=A0A0A1SRW9_9HYPO|nr:Putative Translation initiation factor eIF-2B subunit delta [[Torrubiella] hemipterigena]